MATLLVVNGAPCGSEVPSVAFSPAEALAPGGMAADDLVAGAPVATIDDRAAAVVQCGVHLCR